MNKKKTTQELTDMKVRALRIEETEYRIYSRLARTIRDRANAAVLQRIADDELAHAKLWKEHTGVDVSPYRWKLFKFSVPEEESVLYLLALRVRGRKIDVVECAGPAKAVEADAKKLMRYLASLPRE